MDKISEYLIDSADLALTDYEKNSEMLEYPEIQADKQLYLKILSEYNEKKPIYIAKNALIETEKELDACKKEMAEADLSIKAYFTEEIEDLNKKANLLKDELRSLLSLNGFTSNGAIIELRSGNGTESCRVIDMLSESIISYAHRRGIEFKVKKRVENEKSKFPRLIVLESDSADAFAKTVNICGQHKIIYASAVTGTATTDVITVTVYEKLNYTTVNEEKDIKIEVFHSGGAGGQNINKVETAIRAIHLPTGISVVCQDERSQLKNKKRAVENLKIRIREKDEREMSALAEKTRNAQSEQNRKKIVFDLIKNIVIDKRDEKTEKRFGIPLTEAEADILIGKL